MLKRILFILITITFQLLTLTPVFTGAGLFAQSQFQRAIGGTVSDLAYSIIQTADGGYVAAGWENSFGAGGNDMYIVKFNNSGTLQWSRTIGGTGDDRALSIVQTADGGYAAVGYTTSYGAGDYDLFIVKLDSSGTLQWSKTVGGTGGDFGYYIVRTIDGGYAVNAQIDSYGAGSYDFYIVKLDGSGTLQWSKTVGGTGSDYSFSIVQTADGGYAMAGETESFGAGNSDMYIVKLDGSGTLQWSRTVGGTGFDRARTFIKTTGGGYAMVGQTNSFGGGNQDFYIVKLDSTGTLQWSRTVGGTNIEFAYSITQTTDGGYAAGGFTNSFGGGLYDMYIVKLDASGTLQWNKTVGGTGNDYGRFIIQTADGGYAVAGQVASLGALGTDMFIVKFDSSGNTCGNTNSPSATSSSGGTTTSPTSTVTTPTPTVTAPTPTSNTGGTVVTICTFVMPPPAAPILYSPPNNSTGLGLSLNLVWYRAATAVTYRVQLSTDSLFNTLIVNDSTITDSLKFISGLINNTQYFWRVNAKNAGGTGPWSTVWNFRTGFIGIKPISSEIPKEFKLYDSYPNPFNPTTNIKFDIPKNSKTEIKIYNVLGSEVETLVKEQLKPGTYEVGWDASNYPSGVYFYKFISGNYTFSKKMILLK
ncbi:MAG TPA: T9SS type A sorting domain-containing protein [Ignavibacteria bacterium]